MREGGLEKLGVVCRFAPKIALALILVLATGSGAAQMAANGRPNPGAKFDVKGKSTFELRCATCHGLDGLGGEHAPDIVRRPEVRALSNDALLHVIHEGIPQQGMPGFGDLSQGDIEAVAGYLHFLQGQSAEDSRRGDPESGKALFFGKAGCSGCHQMGSRGQFVPWDLAGFARDHDAGEIREAIVNPSGGLRETAVALAQDGRSFSGIIRNEDNLSLQLQDGDGRFYLLMKSTLASVQKQAAASMPADYGQRLSSTELDDLVSYIVEKAHQPKQPTTPSSMNVEPHAQN